MLASIHPLGERARRTSWVVTVTSHLVGSVLGGAVLGTAAGALGAVALGTLDPGPGAVLGAVAVVGATAAGADLSGRGRLWPTLRRQVDRDWLLRYRGWVYGLGFGVQLGAGVATIVTTAAVHATWLLALLTASPAAGAVVGAVFGAARALPLVGLWWVDGPERLWRLHRRLQAGREPVRALGIAAAAATGALAALAAVGAA
ncbi:MAG TPA: hypothetical protein VFO65_12010 [Acidimicrobiales bacterium]|nr:hypothetical protein [Acidimicrobiales bacterium]